MTGAEIIPYKEPPSLAGLAVKPPFVFLPDKKACGGYGERGGGRHHRASCGGR
jgi:hypothetical protein